MPRRLIPAFVLLVMVTAYASPTKTACAVRAVFPMGGFPVWCQALEWPKP